MNAKSKLKVLYAENVIEMNKAFAKMVENPFSEEYAFLQKIRQDYPEYTVRTREIKKNPRKESYAGLTYQYMRDYILLHAAPEEKAAIMAEFDELLLISRCHSKAQRYPVIKKWFLAKYPEIVQFGMANKAAAKEEHENIIKMPTSTDSEKLSA